jgi:hypothetical protein
MLDLWRYLYRCLLWIWICYCPSLKCSKHIFWHRRNYWHNWIGEILDSALVNIGLLWYVCVNLLLACKSELQTIHLVQIVSKLNLPNSESISKQIKSGSIWSSRCISVPQPRLYLRTNLRGSRVAYLFSFRVKLVSWNHQAVGSG